MTGAGRIHLGKVGLLQGGTPLGWARHGRKPPSALEVAFLEKKLGR